MKLIQALKSLGRFTGMILLMLTALGVGYLTRGWLAPTAGSTERISQETKQPAAAKKAQIWTCSMHPQIKLPKPGKCPICGMTLIPLNDTGSEAEGRRELRIGKYAATLMEIETAPVERRFVETEVRMVGKVEYDETRLSYITAWVPGRLDRLFVDYTGVPVKKGDHLVYMYSPEILTAQQELIQALQAVKDLAKSRVNIVRTTAQATVEAAREKLVLWGLTKEQIAEIERRGTPTDHITIYAPIGGIVVHKNAVEGMYVRTGTRIYTIADLSRVWVKMNAYESDLEWLRYGQKVSFSTESYPGETFTGVISFIDPILDEPTRTVKVRVNVANNRFKLKPGMFVRAMVRSRVASGGKVMAPDLAGKWICPMHPEVIKDSPGKCDVCGMPLVQTESLGYVTPDSGTAPLVIPATAALLTGKRAVVYVQLPNRDRPTFEGREVVLGPRAGDYYIVITGLKAGERVVVKGNFKLDAELQIQAKPSMMTPEGGGGMAGMKHGAGKKSAGKKMARSIPKGPFKQLPAAFNQQFTALVEAYLGIQQALSRDRLETAVQAAETFRRRLGEIDMELLTGPAHMAWMKVVGGLRKTGDALAKSGDIQDARLEFSLLSGSLLEAARRFGGKLPAGIVQVHCPMAFNNRGADWLQTGKEIENPYFGSAMLRCGEIVRPVPEVASPATPESR
ncbi:MAG: efflux RND transporter periplasmic adaptor subunit [Kiritimatiellaeota bacterium]|nr:efflux RND transporter periplasmic adaptor subunit [Kiritimatiellota bacterium]